MIRHGVVVVHDGHRFLGRRMGGRLACGLGRQATAGRLQDVIVMELLEGERRECGDRCGFVDQRRLQMSGGVGR